MLPHFWHIWMMWFHFVSVPATLFRFSVKHIVCVCARVRESVWERDLGEVAAEAGRPAAFGAGPHAAHVLFAEDLIAALRVGAPRQVGAALDISSEQGILILTREEVHTHIKHIIKRWRVTEGRFSSFVIRACLKAVTHHRQSQKLSPTKKQLSSKWIKHGLYFWEKHTTVKINIQ